MDKLFLSVLNMSLTGAFVIAAVCLARLPLKKAPKVISYALWVVAGFRLVFPFSIESVFSLIPFNAAPIPTDIAMQSVPRIESGIPFVNNAVSSVLPAAAPVASVNPLQIWTAIGAYIWIAGVAAMLVYGVASFVILKRKMRNVAHVESNIYEAENIKSPFVLGIFAPKIYLPVGLSEHERGYILLHEQTHIRRRDHIVKMFAYFVLCLHWFNPLAWAAFLLCGADMEMSCDERVMKELGGDIRDDYSMSLVRIAAGRRILNGSPLAFGEGGMKERVKNVLNFRKPSRVIIVAAVTLVAVLSVGFAVNRAYNNFDENKLLTRLGYTKELVSGIIGNKTAFSENNARIAKIIESLPVTAFRKYESFSLGDSREINIVEYPDNDFIYIGGNGLDPFPETVRENNALLLFASLDGLEKVNHFIYNDSGELGYVQTFTVDELTFRFGKVNPLNMSFAELYRALGTNIQLSEFYFSHMSRIWLGADFEKVSYRNMEPDEVVQQSDGSVIWIYKELGATYTLRPSGEREILYPGSMEIYYFNSPLAVGDENLAGLYAKMSNESEWETYDELTAFFGKPDIVINVDDKKKYVAYHLDGEDLRFAYFIIQNNKIYAQGVMYGDDYITLQVDGKFPMADSGGIILAPKTTPLPDDSLISGNSPEQDETWRLDPEEVASRFAADFLNFQGTAALIRSDGSEYESENARVGFTKQNGGEIYIDLYQPEKKGDGGIWDVECWYDENNKMYQVRDLTALPPLFYYDDNVPIPVRESVRGAVTDEWTEAFGRYYQVLGFYASNVNYSETGNAAELKFIMTLITQNFYKDPDTVGYIMQAKENGYPYYQQMYDEYNIPRTGNFDLKVTMSLTASGEVETSSIQVYSNVSPNGEEYVLTKAGDFILSD